MIDKSRLKSHQVLTKDVDMPFNSVYDLFSYWAKKNPDKDFVVFPGDPEIKFTFKDLDKHIHSITSYLDMKDLKKGSRICLIIQNSPEFVLLYFSALASGVTVVPINPDLSPNEMLFIIRNCKAKAVFYDTVQEHKIEQIRAELPILLESVEKYPDFKPYAQAPNKNFLLPKIGHFDEGVIIYTSGTTGNPKGAVLNNLNMLADAKGIHDRLKFDSNTKSLCMLPLFHNNGQIITTLAPLYGGGSTVIIKGKASLMAVWGVIDKYGCTWTSVMAAMLSIFLSLPIERTDKTMLGITSGGQVLTREVQRAFEERFKIPIFENFGLTETTSIATLNDYPIDKRRWDSIGRPIDVNEIKIMDDDGNELPPGTVGEICIRGLNVCTEYFELPEKNKERFRDGWFRSGDFGYCDKDNYFYFKTRKDFLIIKGGENIYPAELENVLFKHPAVAEAAVIGFPHKLLGEDVAAFVKLNIDAKVTEEELKRFCEGKIAKFKQAKRIIIVDGTSLGDIPKGPTKKVLYNKLQDFFKKEYLKSLDV